MKRASFYDMLLSELNTLFYVLYSLSDEFFGLSSLNIPRQNFNIIWASFNAVFFIEFFSFC